ncbi:hypothetical protein BT67DRAFT_232046 [Trichocladium antarcticum]|uniref:Uncharacterized protein n=1 Tax=Trichocladium antarcticum TaxID=1450529 RepID=A0AAN6UN93_9PEZI|nr:hypothetical protein BT67DRAFT_232046 [Trichocladium antarcticum]
MLLSRSKPTPLHMRYMPNSQNDQLTPRSANGNASQSNSVYPCKKKGNRSTKKQQQQQQQQQQ